METIRPFRFDDADTRAAWELNRRLWQEYPLSLAEWREMMAAYVAHPEFPCFWFVTESAQGQVVAVGRVYQTAETYQPGEYWLDLRVEPKNEAHNPMLALNRRLGFTPLPSWVTFRLEAAP